MPRGRRTGIAAALAFAAVAAVTAGCGGGSTSTALKLDPVSAAATKTQNAGAARVRLNLAVNARGHRLGMRGSGVIDGTSAEMSFRLGSMIGQLAPQLQHANLKEIALEQDGDYVIYVKLGFLSSQLPGGEQWVKLDLTKLGKSAGLDLGQLMSGSQLQPNDLLGILEADGAKVQRLGPATIDGVATTHYRVKIDLAKALQAKGLTSPTLKDIAGRLKTATDHVWIGKDGLVRRVRLASDLETPSGNSRVAMTMNLYDYGAKVSIAAPPSSAVFDATMLAQQGLGSLH
ncbi:MAG TPA: hypothetical protein VGI69_11960 [Gaiellaceae bacterium]|jgi:hypothetical protein